MPAKLKTHVQPLSETLDDLQSHNADLLGLARPPNASKVTDPAIEASLLEAEAFIQSSRALLAQSKGLDATGVAIERAKAATFDLERGIK